MPGSLALPKNTTIVCPACGLEIARVVKDIFKGERLKASLFNSLSQDISDGTKMQCPQCEASYFEFGKLFTKEFGFMPKG